MDSNIMTKIKQENYDENAELTYDNTHYTFPNDPYFPGIVFVKTEVDNDEKFAPSVIIETDDGNFEHIWDELLDIVENELPTKGGRKKKRGLKRRKQSEYNKIIDDLIVRSKSKGYSNEELELVWKLISHPASNLNCTQRRRLTFAMLPNKKIGYGIVKSIVNWVKNARVEGFKPTVVVGIYQLLNLYAMYGIVEDNGLSNEETLTGLLLPTTENFVIPWKMHLFRTIVTPRILNIDHVIALNKLQKLKGIKKVHVDDVEASIGVCKLMRSDLFHNDELFSYKPRNLNFPKDALPRFYQCLLRIKAEASTGYHHPMAERIFPEFLPDYSRSGKFASKSVFETVIECMETSKGIAKIVRTPTLLEEFQQWLKLLIHHRFQRFSQLNSLEDYRRYCFIFDTCTAITKKRQEGLPDLSKWMCDFIVEWDFWSFRGFVMGYIPYLLPRHVLPKKHSLRQVFVTRFLNSPWLRSEIWRGLENLWNNWMIDLETNSTGIEWVIEVLDAFLSGLVLHMGQPNFNYGSVEPDSSAPSLTEHICKHYIQVQKKCSGMPDNTLRTKMLNLPDGLLPVVVHDDSQRSVPILCELIAKRDENFATFQMNGDEPDMYTLALPSLRDGSILNAIAEAEGNII